MKQANPVGVFKPEDRVTIISGEFKTQLGVIARIGSAGDITYYHVKMDNYITPMTFVESQIKKG